MVGSSSQSTPLQVLGVLAALVGLVGYVVFDWRFTASPGSVPFALGVVTAGLAVGWTLYRRL
jgi:hypothetical protein